MFPKFFLRAPFGHVRIELGTVFSLLFEFKGAVKNYNIHLGKEVKWTK